MQLATHTGVEILERRVRILVTIGLIGALVALMFVSIEPEIDLSVDELMESPDQYDGETFRLYGTIQSMDMANQTLILQGKEHNLTIDYSAAALPALANENKTISVRGEFSGTDDEWIMHAYEIKTGCPSKYEAET